MSAFWLILACTLGTAPDAPAPIAIDYAMDSDPPLEGFTSIKILSDKYLPLWLQALDRPEADIQRLAATTVALAHQGGAPDMAKAKPALLRILTAKETQLAPRLAAARALLALEAKESAPELWQAAQTSGPEVARWIEPAVARWKYEPAYDVWRKRLAGTGAGHRERMLAIRCLGEVRDTASMPRFIALVQDRQRLDAERLAAAQAAGMTKEEGLEVEARQLAGAGGKVIDRLCAAGLLQRHRGEAARAVLMTLAGDPEPSVAAAALRLLNALDFSLVLPHAEKAMQNGDFAVRREGARCFAANPSVERIQALSKLLDDPHPGVRGMVREDLRRLASDSQWSAAVLKSALDALAAPGWRGQEQAALLLATLDHKPAAPRLVQLLDSPRGEVMIASAWSLKKLAIPETAPAMLQKANQLTEICLRQKMSFEPLDHQLAHLFEALALLKHEPAMPLMNRYIAKNFTPGQTLIMGEYARSAAIWGLGHMHVGKSNESMAAAITGRVTEPSSAMPPEFTRVRLAGTIALGKMKAKSQADALRSFSKQIGPTKLIRALRWSLREITGEELPLPNSPIESQGGWFLEPLDGVNTDVPK